MTIDLTTQEYPAPVPANEPDWNESFLLAGFDAANGIGFWMHLGRWRRDQRMWREVFTVALPDGTVLAHRGIGDLLADERGPGATNYSIRVEEPGRRLRYRYRGGVHRVPAAELAAGLLVNGYMTPLEMNLVFEGVGPVWDLHQKGGSQEFLGAAHIEQLGRVSGTLAFGGEKLAIDAAMGIRDRSMGPRKPRDLRRHHWIQGMFDNGVGFMLFDAEEGEKGFSLSVVTHRDRIFPARIEIPFRIDRLDQQQGARPARAELRRRRAGRDHACHPEQLVSFLHLPDRHLCRRSSRCGGDAPHSARAVGALAAQRRDSRRRCDRAHRARHNRSGARLSRWRPTNPSKPPMRVIALANGLNFRDLGGYPTADDRVVRWRRIFRSGVMSRMDGEDERLLKALGIVTICDFRTTEERQRRPVSWDLAARSS